ncbi:hypothetical protein GCM10010371_45610 [Streptomyces subrutilus]|uniref:Uncharacterized protein n=1 Tax=Streptomyces subrutilus TaxID=36818 RepID=A0A5P2UTJ2_9ACTN|nr:hypothetical protein [Streptomyces subrutilus]QEU81659.1 hypothetical protein CP968_28255 [Streptomyces subrutilus]GGZ80898.1 hypothetical protein GCM10010371_45610 [Streptomyces subrutilus]
MTTAEHLDTIDRLRAREFPAESIWSGGRSSGPGYHLVQVGRTEDLREDGSGRDAATDQISAEYGALAQALTDRWGEAQVFGVGSLRIRGFEGEAIPEPWDEVSASTDHVHVWEVEGRWVLLYAAQWDGGDPYMLMAGVTLIDPP